MKALVLSLTAIAALLFALSLLTGPAGIGAWQGLAALFNGGDGPVPIVMREIRLPRAVLGCAIGAGLGLTGAAMQGYLRNPLAEPGLIGVSGMAALGAVLAIQSGLSLASPLALPVSALIGAAIGIALLFMLAGPQGGSVTLILAGVAISALAGSGTALVLNLSPNPYAANEIVFWLMGSLADRSMVHVWLALPPMMLGAVLIWTTRRALDALTLGESAAAAMGVSPAALRLRLVIGVALIVGPATAVAGAIGFVGLVVPHILRPWVGARPSALLLTSALGGAVLLLSADIAVRLILPERDLKLGVITALVGAPLFLHLIWKTRSGGRM
ncbi:FecCD family ABC transporter permease [Paracoccus seriniphilus]|uniref:Iron complex transport system permease protein n=1 Tax=Paracoccus seriniphilus TaxID=184748 RepID=A0A239PWX3_9RHOB|nr:iron ABC transporter permease [Paracoccus seriniphilus]WCR13324.1 iron ABC transporter permease [Paracoccus seriniphilus]SNT74436.1 iron complex transport system permease protein [Paracoccus seriniphilus]